MMKYNGTKIGAALLAGALTFAVLGACSPEKPSVLLEAPGTSQEAPAETAQPDNQYDFPEMGLTAVFPESLMTRIERGEVAAFISEIGTEDSSALQYGYLSWYAVPEDQWDAGEIKLDDLECFGVLGVYQTDLADRLDDLTGCDEHRELGQSADGKYKYYLSTNTAADGELAAELRQTQVTVTEMSDFSQSTDYGTPSSDFAGTSVGEFTTQDVKGNTYTQDMFQDYDLTLINIFTTWCSPCVAEMPDLEKLHQQMADRGVNIVGIVLDVLNEKGEIVQEDLEQAQLLVERTGVTYPVLLPDSTYMNGRLTRIEAVPETFFVDKDGNIVGETYSGSGSLEDWLEVVEKELANLKEGA